MTKSVFTPYLILTLQCAVITADHPWSPIIAGKAVVPPVIPPSSPAAAALIQNLTTSTSDATPRSATAVSSNSGGTVTSRNLSEKYVNTNRYQLRRRPVWRRRRRRRRFYPTYRFYLRPQLRSFSTTSAQVVAAPVSSTSWRYQSPLSSVATRYRSLPPVSGLRLFPARYRGRSPPSPRARVNRPRARAIQEEEFSLTSEIRNLFSGGGTTGGRSARCTDGLGRSQGCTLTPVCWLTGGVASDGCDSLLYTCCKSPEVGGRARSADMLARTVAPAPSLLEKRAHHNWVLQEPECGVSRHRQFSKRIIGGEKAKFAELPWQVHIRISSYQCGGVLLNHWYIATAAHCVHRAKLNKISVHLGEFDTKDEEKEPLDSQTYKVEHIIIHPDFRYMLTQPDRYDVALLQLDRPVLYQENILPICLPPSDIPLQGKIGVVAGWGKTDNSYGKTGTNILHKVEVPIIDNDECIKWHEDKNILVQLHSEMFCAGHRDGKMDACLGDSGGPLIIHHDGRWTLIGITSAGFGCAVDKQPGIYHKIGMTSSWILDQINEKQPEYEIQTP